MVFPSSQVIFHHNNENSNNYSARKAGNTLTSRKPFADCSVNKKFQNTGNKKCEKHLLNNPIAKQDKSKYKDEDLVADTCSFKEIPDTYEDIYPEAERWIKHDTAKIKDFYLNLNDPPRMGNIEVTLAFSEMDVDSVFVSLPKHNFKLTDMENIDLSILDID